MGSRRRAREAALQILYSLEFQEEVAAACKRYWEETVGTATAPVVDDLSSPPEGEVAADVRAFAERIVAGVLANRDAIDKMIRDASTNWRLERMALVDRNILRLATFELFHVPEVPSRVTLNEAIELGKRYGTEDSKAFINGILDRISTWANKP